MSPQYVVHFSICTAGQQCSTVERSERVRTKAVVYTHTQRTCSRNIPPSQQVYLPVHVLMLRPLLMRSVNLSLTSANVSTAFSRPSMQGMASSATGPSFCWTHGLACQKFPNVLNEAPLLLEVVIEMLPGMGKGTKISVPCTPLMQCTSCMVAFSASCSNQQDGSMAEDLAPA